MAGRRVIRVADGIGSPSALRDANRRRVLDALRRYGAASQAELARQTGLSRATVFNIVRELHRAGVVTIPAAAAGGRRAGEIAFSQRAGLAVGIDIDHRHLRVAVADLNHQVLAEHAEVISDGAGADTVATLIARLVTSLLRAADATHEDVTGAGMCLSGPIERATGAVGSSSILPGWAGVRAAELVRHRLGLPVVVDNDANLGALAEATWGAARGRSDVVYLKLATGVGAGLIIGGELYRGVTGTAGEIGHTTVDERGAVCRCGNRGCLETYAGGAALLNLLRHTHGPDLTLTELVRRAVDGDAGCQRVIADAGRHVGVALANLCNVLAPDCLVIGGELATAGDVLLGPLRDALRRHAIRPAADAAEVLLGALGDRAEVLGAIALVLREEPLSPIATAGAAGQ